MTELREQGETRRQIVYLLRHHGQMTAAELSDALTIGAVGIRQHLALLERDALVHIAGIRRAVGRPSHLYALTEAAEVLFPRRYDHMLLDALDFIEQRYGREGLDAFFVHRRTRLLAELGPQLQGLQHSQRLQALTTMLNAQGYMCSGEHQEDGSFTLIQHNCPIDCAARNYQQACEQEQLLYEDLLDADILRDKTIAQGDLCCRYSIKSKK